jgi:hypothetical protein
MRKAWIAGIIALLALAGCAAAPNISETPTPRAVPQESARVFVYRWLEPYESLEFARVDLDGRPLGYAQNGAAFFRDITPGRHTITVVSRGRYPGQTATVTLTPQETLYVRIASLSTWDPSFPDETFTLRFADPTTGAGDVASLPLVTGWGWSRDERQR